MQSNFHIPQTAYGEYEALLLLLVDQTLVYFYPYRTSISHSFLARETVWPILNVVMALFYISSFNLIDIKYTFIIKPTLFTTKAVFIDK